MSPARPRTQRRADTMAPSAVPAQRTFVFTRDAVRAVDHAAVHDLAIPSLLLMEHASLALARHARDMLRDSAAPAALIICGKGNNAGDGIALARHLHLEGLPVHLVLCAPDDSYSGDAATNLAIARRLRIPITIADEHSVDAPLRAALSTLPPAPLVVDALLGTGLSGPPRGVILHLIHAVNRLAADASPILSIDIPSGLDADTGEPASPHPDHARSADVVRADRTVTLVGLKKGFLTLSAQAYLGQVCIEGIGTPMELSVKFGTPLTFAHHLGAPPPDEPPPPPAPRRAGDRSRR